MSDRRQSFISGAAILAFAVLLTKLIGALYKIPLGNLLDSDGMAHFYVAYNIYSLLLTLSTAGLPLALSRMVSEAETLGLENQKHRIFHTATGLLLAVGIVCAAGMYLLAAPLSSLLHDTQAETAVRMLSPAVLFVCLMSVIRGYTQGQGNMRPTAASEIIESLCKSVAGFLLAWLLLRRNYPKHIAAAGAIAGVTVGTAAALLALVIYLLGRRGRKPSRDVPERRRNILRRLLQIGIPITLGACGMSLLNLLDTSLVLGTLQRCLGCSEELAATLYGQYTYGMNLFTLPVSFIFPLTISLIPAISAARAQQNLPSAKRHTEMALRVTALLVLPAGAGLSVLAGPILHLLYPNVPETAEAAAYHLTILGIASIFVCLMSLTNGILQAYGKEYVPIFTLVAGGLVKIISNYLLVGDPDIGIHGAPWSTLLCYALITVLNFIAIRYVVPRGTALCRGFLRPALATALMAVAARSGYGLLCRVMSSRTAVLPAIVLSVAVYGALVLALGAVRREDLMGLPQGEKLAQILKLH